MNWKRLALCAMLGITVLGTTACSTKTGEQPQGNTVKAETVAMPNFTNAPIADEYAIFDTNYGQFKVRLLGSKAPITVKNFDYLVKKGFYDGLIFHRITKILVNDRFLMFLQPLDHRIFFVQSKRQIT